MINQSMKRLSYENKTKMTAEATVGITQTIDF